MHGFIIEMGTEALILLSIVLEVLASVKPWKRKKHMDYIILSYRMHRKVY